VTVAVHSGAQNSDGGTLVPFIPAPQNSHFGTYPPTNHQNQGNIENYNYGMVQQTHPINR
jgi:hypothetical protein